MVSFQILGYIHIDRKEVRRLNPHEVFFIVCHEFAHKKLWYRFCLTVKSRQKLEREVQRIAVQDMLRYGYSFEDCLLMEFNYRLLNKYDLTLEEYFGFMK